VQGFTSNSKVIRVDVKNTLHPFYYFQNNKEEQVTFNLPDGFEYDFKCICEPCKPVEYICPPLPKREKFIMPLSFDEYKIFVEDNPHKAQVNILKGIIKLDKGFFNEPIPMMYHVLFHEIGHNLYFAEWKCDVFAANEMLKIGFNPSQCFYSDYFCLSNSENNKKRRENFRNWLFNVKSKK